jgi:purine-binding chemotaxis protein CheW
MERYCTFTLADQWFGVDVDHVQEVIRAHIATPVPLAPPSVEGLINLRGQILTSVDLGRKLGRNGQRARAESATHVIVKTPEGPVGVRVDRVGEVIDGTALRKESLPPGLDDAVRGMAGGVLMLEDRLVVVLDALKAGSP